MRNKFSGVHEIQIGNSLDLDRLYFSGLSDVEAEKLYTAFRKVEADAKASARLDILEAVGLDRAAARAILKR